jgi:hypothetical protein
MKIKKYPRLEIVGSYKNINWQELNNFLQDIFNPLSLREFRGHVGNIIISDYATSHWNTEKEKKALGNFLY